MKLSTATKLFLTATVLAMASGELIEFGINLCEDNECENDRNNDISTAEAAETRFRSRLSNERVEDFESKEVGDTDDNDLSVSLGGSCDCDLTIEGDDINIVIVEDSDDTDGSGRFPTSGETFLEVTLDGGNRFRIEVDSGNLKAFGFYATDLGDQPGSYFVRTYNNNSPLQTFDIPLPIGLDDDEADGSVFYFGVIADDVFNAVEIGGDSETFGFDDFTVARASQVPSTPAPISPTPPPTRAPVPPTPSPTRPFQAPGGIGGGRRTSPPFGFGGGGGGGNRPTREPREFREPRTRRPIGRPG